MHLCETFKTKRISTVFRYEIRFTESSADRAYEEILALTVRT